MPLNLFPLSFIRDTPAHALKVASSRLHSTRSIKFATEELMIKDDCAHYAMLHLSHDISGADLVEMPIPDFVRCATKMIVKIQQIVP